MVLSSLSHVLRQPKPAGAKVSPLGYIWHPHLGFCGSERLVSAVGWHPDVLVIPRKE